jgi:hypothetical protein
VNSVCPECGYNAGENGEKILELHMSTQHGPNSPRFMTHEQAAKIQAENSVIIARSYLVLGFITTVIGLALVFYGSNNFAILTCRASSCFRPQSIIDQVNASGFPSAYIDAQETTYAGLLLFTLGFMGLAYWPVQRFDLVPRIQLVLLVGIFTLILVTGFAISGGIIPFGQRIIPPTG